MTNAQWAEDQIELWQHDYSLWQSINTLSDERKDWKTLYQAQACWHSKSLTMSRTSMMSYNHMSCQIKEHDC